jgi:hypothetical protein
MKIKFWSDVSGMLTSVFYPYTANSVVPKQEQVPNMAETHHVDDARATTLRAVSHGKPCCRDFRVGYIGSLGMRCRRVESCNADSRRVVTDLSGSGVTGQVLILLRR